MNALVAGVPQVVLPYGADQHMNAASVERRGVGLTHLPEESDAATVGHSLQRLLQKPAFREAANQVRQEIAAQVSPAELVPRLAEVVSCAEVFGEGKDRT